MNNHTRQINYRRGLWSRSLKMCCTLGVQYCNKGQLPSLNILRQFSDQITYTSWNKIYPDAKRHDGMTVLHLVCKSILKQKQTPNTGVE